MTTAWSRPRHPYTPQRAIARMAWLSCLLLLLSAEQALSAGPDLESTVSSEEARWWTLTDELTPEQLKEKWSPEASRKRLAGGGALGGPNQCGSALKLNDLVLHVDGKENPELVPMWWTFARLASMLENVPDGRAQTADSWQSYGISQHGLAAVLDAAEALEIRKIELSEQRETKVAELEALLDSAQENDVGNKALEALEDGVLQPMAKLVGRTTDELQDLISAGKVRPERRAAANALAELKEDLDSADWNALRDALFETQASDFSATTMKLANPLETLTFGNLFQPIRQIVEPGIWQVSAMSTVTYRCSASTIRSCPSWLHVLLTSCFMTDEHHGGNLDLPVSPINPNVVVKTEAHHLSGFVNQAYIDSLVETATCEEVGFHLHTPGTTPKTHWACLDESNQPFKYRIWVNGAIALGDDEKQARDRCWNDQSECTRFHHIRVEAEGLANGEVIHVNLQATDENGNVVGSVGGPRTVSTSVDYGQVFLNGWHYSLSVLARPPGKVCFTRGAQGQVGGSDVTVNVRCAPPVDLGAQVTGLAPGQTADVTVAVTANGETRSETLSFDRDQTQFYTIHAIRGASYSFSTDNPSCSPAPASGTVPSQNPVLTTVTCDGSSESFGVGVEANLDSVPGVPPVSSVTVHLDANAADGSPIPRQSIVVQGPNGSYQFPNMLPVGSTYTISYNPPPYGAICHLTNAGPAVIQGPVTVHLTCNTIPTDWCDVMPDFCYVPDPNPACSTFFQIIDVTNIVTTCGFVDGQLVDCQTTASLLIRGVTTCTFGLRSTVTQTETRTATVGGSAGRNPQVEYGPIVTLRNRSDLSWSGNMPVFGVARHDNATVGSIELYVDGQRMHLSNLQRDQHDPWTCNEHPSSNCNANSRFIGYLDTTALSDGPHSFLLKVNRADGSIYSASETTLTIDNSNNCSDTTPPSLSFATPTNGATLNRGPNTVQFNAGDSGSGIEWVELRDNGSLISRDTASPYRFYWNASAGNHTLQGKARDACGNETVRSIQVTAVDPCAGLPAPVVSFPGFEDGQDIEPNLYHFTADVSSNAPGGVSFVQFQVANFPARVYHSAPFVTNGYWLTTEGPVQLTATAHDACGRTGTKTIELNVTHSSSVCQLDTGPPVVTITSPTDGSSHSPGDITITTQVSDQSPLRAASLWVDGQYLSGSAIATGDTSAYRWTWPATSGSHTLQVRALDVCDKMGASPTIQIHVQ